jgi:endoglucanase
VSRDGIPTGLICIPLRYMHSPVEMVSPNDITQTGRLVAHFIADINEEFLTNLIPKEGWED